MGPAPTQQRNNKGEQVMKRIKFGLIISALGSALLLGSGISMAQDSDGAVRFGENNEPAVYISVTFVSYKEGKGR
jgi:hypothetical protein